MKLPIPVRAVAALACAVATHCDGDENRPLPLDGAVITSPTQNPGGSAIPGGGGGGDGGQVGVGDAGGLDGGAVDGGANADDATTFVRDNGAVIGPSDNGVVIGPSDNGAVIGPSDNGVVIGPQDAGF